MEVDWMELKDILDYAMRTGKLSKNYFKLQSNIIYV